MQRTFVMIKPDGVQRRLVGRIIQRFEQAGLTIAAMKFLRVSEERAAQHYAVHEGKPFYKKLISYITSGPVVAMVIEGEQAIDRVRTLVGSTNPQEATPGTIRGDFCQHIGRNAVHASDGPETADQEIALWFSADEVVTYAPETHRWVYE